MVATNSEELDLVLLDFPCVEQSDPVENAEFIRYTVQLRIDPDDHDQPPQLFLIFSQDEFRKARMVQGVLESQFRTKLEKSSFTDALNGKLVHTSLRQDRNGIWTAITVDGSMWLFDKNQERWIKGPFGL